jgi:hypothetical protein
MTDTGFRGAAELAPCLRRLKFCLGTQPAIL